MQDAKVLVVGIDGSDASSHALGWAAREAARRGARLHVVKAYSIPVYGGGFDAVIALPPGDLEELHQSQVQRAEDQVAPIRAQYPDVEIELLVKSGAPVATITEGAKGAELVVVGSRGAGSLAALIIGSVARGVAHRATCPVVIVPDGVLKPAVTRIVVGSDGSPGSAAAIEWACKEAVLWATDLTVAHAWEYPYLGPRTGIAEPHELMELDAAESLAHDVRMTSQLTHGPVPVHAKLLEGTPATALVNFAAEADLLVIGPRGRGGIRSALLGSTSAYAISHARCPIAIVHTDDHP